MADPEINWIEQVELYFALADSDAKFERVLNTYLCPLVSKLDIARQDVKDKVLALLTHINKLLKSSSSIVLPVKELLDVFLSGSITVQSFALIYCEMGLSRMIASVYR
jgi:proteasome component ECM29